MPSRQLRTTSAPTASLLVQTTRHHLPPHFVPAIASASSAAVVLLLFVLLLIYLRRRLPHSRGKTAPSFPPSPTPPAPFPLRFTFDQLRVATSNFHPSFKLGQGGFGPVFRATLAAPVTPIPVAVKLMSSSSLQGDIEFRNELSLSSSLPAASPFLLLPLGYCEDHQPLSSPNHKRKKKKKKKKNRSPDWIDAFDDASDLDPDDADPVFMRKRLLLVYNLMDNGSLQDALLVRQTPELMDWRKRFAIALDVARGLVFLHFDCHPPVVHGDIKPSNVLLDDGFRARIADFGLARVLEIDGSGKGEPEEADNMGEEEEVSVVEDGAASPELSPIRLETLSTSDVTGGFDKASVESGGLRRNGSEPGKDWWWRQDGEGGGEAGGGGGGEVKDYVMEWIGSEIRKDQARMPVPASLNKEVPSITGKKRQYRNLDWWSFGDDGLRKKKTKPRRPREWWREEFCDELCKKSKRKQAVIIPKSNFCSIKGLIGSDKQWWPGKNEHKTPSFSKKRSCSRGGSSAQYNMELRVAGRWSIPDFHSGDIPKSGGISSTPSMRGTVCYSAPECGGGAGEILSEKCDVYSFGVLLLVIVSGRRPLQVTASPMSEFERANLISWARNLAHRGGNLLDLLDRSLHGVDMDQALILITVALHCLQRSPARRPTIKEVVEMLSGDLEPPPLPIEFSPSPPCAFPCKSRRKECR